MDESHFRRILQKQSQNCTIRAEVFYGKIKLDNS